MAITEADFNDLKTRVSRPERASVNNTETITWMAGTLGTMKAVQDNQTKRLDEHSKLLEDHTGRLERIEADVAGLRKDMPGIVAEAMREVLRKP
jgi:uncharacterized protein YicC (UPF0701 family)